MFSCLSPQSFNLAKKKFHALGSLEPLSSIILELTNISQILFTVLKVDCEVIDFINIIIFQLVN